MSTFIERLRVTSATVNETKYKTHLKKLSKDQYFNIKHNIIAQANKGNAKVTISFERNDFRSEHYDDNNMCEFWLMDITSKTPTTFPENKPEFESLIGITYEIHYMQDNKTMNVDIKW